MRIASSDRAHSERGLRKALDEADFYDLDEKYIIIMICLRRAWALRRAPLRPVAAAPRTPPRRAAFGASFARRT